MSYYQYGPNPLEKRVKELQEDKIKLSNAITELNECYQQKIKLLQYNLTEQQQKYAQLLSWKQEEMGKNLYQLDRYDAQIKKVIDILDTAHKNFEKEKEELQRMVSSQKLQINDLKQENKALQDFSLQTESKIQEMVKFYTQEIGKLKDELKELKEQSNIDQDSIRELKDITSKQNSSFLNESSKISEMMMDVDPMISKVSTMTVE